MAQDSLQSARDLDPGNPRSAISRYYAAYQSITAVLLFLQQTPPEEREAWSHVDTPDLVVTAFIPVMFSRDQRREIQHDLNRLYVMRCDADYVSIIAIREEHVKEAGKFARKLCFQSETILLGGRNHVHTNRN